MKKLFAALLLTTLMLSVASGAERLRIIDASGIESSVLNAIALPWAKKKQIEISIRKVDADTALEKLAAKESDIVILPKENVPAKFSGSSRIFGYRAVVAVVNNANPVRSLTGTQLNKILSSKRPCWSDFGGDSIDIHRYAVKRADGTPDGREELRLFAAAEEMLLLDTMNEVVLLTRSDPAALAWGPGTISLPEECVALKINGVPPLPECIRDGSYAPSRAFAVLLSPAPSGAAREFFAMLGSNEFYRLLEDNGLIPPGKNAEVMKRR